MAVVATTLSLLWEPRTLPSSGLISRVAVTRFQQLKLFVSLVTVEITMSTFSGICHSMFNKVKLPTVSLGLKANQTVQTLNISRAAVFKIYFLYVRAPLVSPMKKDNID
jgi:hypothetical protein